MPLNIFKIITYLFSVYKRKLIAIYYIFIYPAMEYGLPLFDI